MAEQTVCVTSPHRVSRAQRGALWYCFRLLPGAIGALLVLLVLEASPARAGMPPLDELESGQLLLAGNGIAFQPAVLQETSVDLQISGMVAVVTLTQRFVNVTDVWVEGVYAFPLPDGAAVRGMDMRIGDRQVIGRIREREAAQAAFVAASKAGKKASLVEQQRPNLFTNRVANIAPGESVEVSLEYVQAVAYEDGVFSLRMPTTITPRYIPGNPAGRTTGEEAVLLHGSGWAVPTDQVPDADQISPRQNPRVGSDANPINPLRLKAVLDMGMPLASVESIYHQVALQRDGRKYELELAGGRAEMDRDFLLQWRPTAGSSPRAALFTERVGEEHYGLLMVVPPVASPVVMPREVVFVVDTSGSMGGVSIEQARASLDRALDQLRPDDRFNIIAFDTDFRRLYRQPEPANPHNLARAREFVRLLSASGGTEMLPALRAALAEQAELHEQRLRQIIFITDGAVGNEKALFAEIAENLGHARLFTVGIGSAPNGWFMRRAADFGRGTHTRIADLAEVGARMDALFADLAAPVALDLDIDWPTAVESWPARLPDLYQGQPLIVAVSFGEVAPTGAITVTGTLGGQAWEQRLLAAESVPGSAGSGHAGVASLWARHKITALLDEKVMGREESAVRADVLPLALTHRLLSPYTSFVAIEQVISRPAGTDLVSEAVPNTRPAGQSPQTFAWPATATTGPAKFYLGSLLLFLALMIRVMGRPEVDRDPTARK